MDMKILVRRCLISILMMNVFVPLFADIDWRDVVIEKDLKSDSVIRVKSIKNNSDNDIKIILRDHNNDVCYEVEILKGESKTINKECSRIDANTSSVNTSLWNKKKTKEEWDKEHPVARDEKIKEKKEAEEKKEEEKKENPVVPIDPNPDPIKEEVSGEDVIKDYKNELEKDSLLSLSAIDNDKNIINSIGKSEDKVAYIDHHNLKGYIKEKSEELTKQYTDEEIETKADLFLKRYDYKIKSDFNCKDSIKSIIKERLEMRKATIDQLKNLIDTVDRNKETNNYLPIGIGVIVVLVGLIAWIILLAKKKKDGRKQDNIQQSPDTGLSPAIVVKKTTSTVLKEQSIENVVNNKAYYKIECSEFCDDSAVKSIYIKNTCIKAIYNMYADDLRNPNNPKEDGCMVLGRWICDEVEKEYYVSLEEIVLPGNDAVFKEYELNFGGKIKLRVAEKLRKLRKESNLQYDLTCWVHSHPGLGVFFSNSDSGVQMQLKHPTHPNFLIAIVVDILTPQQEFGIFTFKHDSTINSKNDLKKMYSLEELYKWAIESERFSYKPEDYYNSLSKADRVNDNCRSIMLSNGAIIDISSLVTGRNTGLSGLAYGYELRNNGKTELIINSISKSENANGDDLLGCFVIGTHCDMQTIRNVMSKYAGEIRFVMFYSMPEETVTLIPVINNQMSMDSKYFAEEKLEDLKIWTRRKR
ncbi:MAG: hypothetical protein IJ328_01050 [Muribaculaceae bacterium]|nr:hypothetical protein [Muribaculaceae bacterium]